MMKAQMDAGTDEERVPVDAKFRGTLFDVRKMGHDTCVDVPESQLQTWRDDVELIVGRVDKDSNGSGAVHRQSILITTGTR